MTNSININPEETLIYKELKSKFEVQDPELWKEVSENLKQVIEDKNVTSFEDDKVVDICFIWSETKQGNAYWAEVSDNYYEIEYE